MHKRIFFIFVPSYGAVRAFFFKFIRVAAPPGGHSGIIAIELKQNFLTRA